MGLLLFLVFLAHLARSLNPEGLSALAFFVGVSATHDPLFQAPFSMALVLVLASAYRGDQSSSDPIGSVS